LEGVHAPAARPFFIGDFHLETLCAQNQERLVAKEGPLRNVVGSSGALQQKPMGGRGQVPE